MDSQDEVGSYEDEYQIEEVTIVVKDYISHFVLPQGQYKNAWETVGADPKIAETANTFQLPFKNMETAVLGVIKFLGMTVCEGTDRVNVTEKVHNLLLAGMFMGHELVLVRG